MANIVVIGSLNMDLVTVAPSIPRIGETIAGSKFLMTPGGKGANQAYAAALLGGRVSMLGKVGDDDMGRQLIANLARSGCDVQGVRLSSAHTGVALIYVSEAGENSIVIVLGANGTFAPEEMDARMAPVGPETIVLLQLEIPLETVLAAAVAATRRGARVILDPAPAPPRGLPPGLLEHVDIVTPNETEAGQLVGWQIRQLSRVDALAVADEIQALGVRKVILKLGAQGCLLADDALRLFIPAPEVEAVDSTAAGDAFNAALAVALTMGRELPDACSDAVHAASLSVTRLGAQRSMPTLEEMRAFRKKP